MNDRTGHHLEMSHKRRKEPTAGFPMSAKFVVDFDGRPIADQTKDKAFFGQEAEFIRQGSAGDAREHALHFVEAARPGDVQRGQDFDGPP